jgi:hypothetical protein
MRPPRCQQLRNVTAVMFLPLSSAQHRAALRRRSTMQKLFYGLTAINCMGLVLLAANLWPANAGGEPQVLRGTGLEIVDAQGRARATIGILPAGNGGTETVLLRLINAAGQPSVKIGTTQSGAGLSIVGGDDLSYAILQADGMQSTLKLKQYGSAQVEIGPAARATPAN